MPSTIIQPSVSPSAAIDLSPEQRLSLHQLIASSGLCLREEAVDCLINLLALGVAPQAINQVLQAVCKTGASFVSSSPSTRAL